MLFRIYNLISYCAVEGCGYILTLGWSSLPTLYFDSLSVLLRAHLNPKTCPDSLPSVVKVDKVRVTIPLIFLGEISPRYIKWVFNPKPADRDRWARWIQVIKTYLWAACIIRWLTCWVAIQESRHNDHFERADTFAYQHDRCCSDSNEAVEDHCFLSEEGTRVTSGLSKLCDCSQCELVVLHSHLPIKPEMNLTLMAPKSPPTANMETIRDQIIVTVCGGGSSLYL